MSKCPKCGFEVESGMKFCGECGTPIPQVKECPKCHAQCSLTTKFCGECGYNFNASVTGAGAVIGDKNVIAGDVRIDQSSMVNNNTVNNVTNTTNNVVNNVINQDDTKKVVRCVVCGKQLPIVDSCVCSCCDGTVCKDHFDKKRMLCLTCVAKQTAQNDEEFRKNLLALFADCPDGEDPDVFGKMEKQRIACGISINASIDLLTYWDDDMDVRRPIAEGMDKWFLKICMTSSEPEARYYVGRCYEGGVGSDDGPCMEKAVKAYQSAAKHGYEDAEKRLREIDPHEIHIELKANSFAEIGLTRFSNGSSAYSMPLEDRMRYRVVAQHEKQYRFPILNRALFEVSVRSMLTGQRQDFVIDPVEIGRENGTLFSLEDWNYDEDGGTEYLAVSKYRDAAEFFGYLVISGKFEVGKLKFVCESYDDNFSPDIDEDERLEVSKRLCGDDHEIVMLRAFDYQGEKCEPMPTGYWEGCGVIAKTSHLFTPSAYDWEFDVFSNKQNIRRLKVDVFGPGIDVRGLACASSRLKEMSKYDIPDWDATWNLFTYSTLLLDSATLRVVDAGNEDALIYEGPLSDRTSLVERGKKNNFVDMIYFGPNEPDACGVTVIYNKNYEYHRIMTCCYDGEFSPSLIEVPWFGLDMFGDGKRHRLMCQMMDLKICGVWMRYSEEDEEVGEPMDIVGIESWIQYKDKREPWGILNLEDALKLQENAKE